MPDPICRLKHKMLLLSIYIDVDNRYTYVYYLTALPPPSTLAVASANQTAPLPAKVLGALPHQIIANTMNEPLSPRQQQTLDVIKRHIDEHGLPPTIREIMAELKVEYPRGVQRHLEALEKKGYITRDSRSRGITLLGKLRQAAADASDAIARIPVLGRIPAGGPLLAEENVEDWVTLPTDLTKGKQDVFILRAQGDSMIGAGIFDGDLLICQPTDQAENGDIVAALIGDDATVKRLVKRRDSAYLKPENPKYDNIYPDQEWKVQGKVMAVVRPQVR